MQVMSEAMQTRGVPSNDAGDAAQARAMQVTQ
jgi:hypothetical protein